MIFSSTSASLDLYKKDLLSTSKKILSESIKLFLVISVCLNSGLQIYKYVPSALEYFKKGRSAFAGIYIFLFC